MTVNKTIEERVKEVVTKAFHKKVTEISRDTRFLEDLHAKSINSIELTAMLEHEFNIEIPGAQARRAKNVGAAVDLIESLLEK